MDRADQFIPHLIVSDGLAAIDFYKQLFGAEEGHRMMAPDGKRLMHGEIVLDGHKFFLSDQFEAQRGRHAQISRGAGRHLRANHDRGQRC